MHDKHTRPLRWVVCMHGKEEEQRGRSLARRYQQGHLRWPDLIYSNCPRREDIANSESNSADQADQAATARRALSDLPIAIAPVSRGVQE